MNVQFHVELVLQHSPKLEFRWCQACFFKATLVEQFQVDRLPVNATHTVLALSWLSMYTAWVRNIGQRALSLESPTKQKSNPGALARTQRCKSSQTTSGAPKVYERYIHCGRKFEKRTYFELVGTQGTRPGPPGTRSEAMLEGHVRKLLPFLSQVPKA